MSTATASATVVSLDELIEGYLREHGPASSAGLAKGVQRRRADVDAALLGDPVRFVRRGRGPTTRWALVEQSAPPPVPPPADRWGGLPAPPCVSPEAHFSFGSHYRANGGWYCAICGVRKQLVEQRISLRWQGEVDDVCLRPDLHVGTQWRDDDGELHCIMCQGVNPGSTDDVLLPFALWAEGWGTERQRQWFEDAFVAYIDGRATPEQVARVRAAFPEEQIADV